MKLNLVSTGLAFKCLRHHDVAFGSHDTTNPNNKWMPLANRQLAPVADTLLSHLARVLSICAHVLDEEAPAAPASSRTSLPSLPNAVALASPIKRKVKLGKEENVAGGSTPEKHNNAGACEEDGTMLE